MSGPSSRFDLGGPGRAAWYTPNKQTLFPRKKIQENKRDDSYVVNEGGREAATLGSETRASPSQEQQRSQEKQTTLILKGTTDEDAAIEPSARTENSQAAGLSITTEERVLEYTKVSNAQSGAYQTTETEPESIAKYPLDGPRLRTRRSLELQVKDIEDEESRRLTAIAFLL